MCIRDRLGAKCYVINNEPNGLNINNNAGSTHIEGLQKYVVDNGLAVGFAYDGDADRCLCVDELGNVITGDHILLSLIHICIYCREQCALVYRLKKNSTSLSLLNQSVTVSYTHL